MLEHYQKNNYILQQINPTLKIVAVIATIFMMMFIFDPWTPLILWLVTLGMIHFLGGIPLRFIALLMIPFSFFAFSFVWISIVFPDQRGETILFHIGPLPVALENVKVGLSLGLRSFVFASWSMLFVLTTEPTKFMLSLIQHCKLSPRIGYGMMAAYRFLPLFRQELNQIRAAHRIRGLGEAAGLRGRWEQLKRYTIPLMAGAIRKAERVAIAMESKGFDGSRDRSYYHVVKWTYRDLIFGFCFILLMSSLLIVRQKWI